MVASTLLVLVVVIAATYIIYQLGISKGEVLVERKVGVMQAERRQAAISNQELLADWRTATNQVRFLEAQLVTLKSQKKSSEVRTGLIAEQLAPFLDGFPYDYKKGSDITFAGRPIDFIIYSENGIHFVEVKSGKAQLSTKQRRIRDQIANNEVTFEVYRIKGE